MKHQEHLLTAAEIERLSKEAEAQFLKQNGAGGTIEIKTPAADAMERNNSPLVTNDLANGAATSTSERTGYGGDGWNGARTMPLKEAPGQW